MGFFSKKEKGQGKIPELPELPNLPDFSEFPKNDLLNAPFSNQQEIQKTSTLPSFQNSSLGERINQDTIKEAINEEPEFINTPQRFRQNESIRRINPREPLTKEIGEEFRIQKFLEPTRLKSLEMSDWEKPHIKHSPIIRSEPLFIQLDKFEKTVSAFDEIKLQMSEIDSLLKSIKDTKRREDEKLSHWENEIESIKARLDQIDKEIFSRI